MKIKIVLFDAAGVLFPLNKVVGEDLAAKFHLSEEQLQPMWKGFYPEYSVGKLTTAEFLDLFATTFSLSRNEVTKEVFTKSFLKALAPMPGMEDILIRLSKTGATLAMLSDTTEMFAEARRKSLFSQYFDHVFLSFEIGYRKPDQRAFQAVTKFYKVHPKEIFFIDDNKDNVSAALQYGMQATIFTDSATLVHDLERAGILN